MIRSYRLAFVISLFLTLATVAVFWQLPGHDFVTIDDNVYVTSNSHVNSGLTAKSIRWAFTTVKAEFWHPLTWLSLMADTQIFGGRPGGYHLTNLLLHIINTLLLFFSTQRRIKHVVLAAHPVALCPLYRTTRPIPIRMGAGVFHFRPHVQAYAAHIALYFVIAGLLAFWPFSI
jgi:hypothetical protein